MTVELRLFEEGHIFFRVSSMFVCKNQRKHLRGLSVYLKKKRLSKSAAAFHSAALFFRVRFLIPIVPRYCR